TIRQLLVVFDDPGASNRVDRRPPLVILLVSFTQTHHPDDLVALECIGDHLAVSRLVDHERAGVTREQHHFGQGKKRNLGRKFSDLRRSSALCRGGEGKSDEKSERDREQPHVHSVTAFRSGLASVTWPVSNSCVPGSNNLLARGAGKMRESSAHSGTL